MIKKILKHILTLFIISVVVIFLLEDATRLFVNYFRPELKQKYDMQIYSKGFEFPQGYSGHFRPSAEFGYVFADGNNYGFHSKGDLPLYRKPNTYIIAVLGGSVAYHFINYLYNNGLDEFAKKIKSSIPALKNKELEFVSFAIPGYKQPQQYYVLSYFIDQLDMIIQIDGWNEVSSANPNEFPADFPMSVEKNLTGENLKKFNSAKSKKALIHLLESNTILRKSMTAYLLKNTLEVKMISELQQLHTKISLSKYQKTEVLVNVWSKNLLMERNLLKEKNKKGFFFVQASQYNPDTKKFTAEEKQLAINPKIDKFAGSSFQQLRKEAQKINVFDLAEVFKNETSTIYIDDCCHVNLKGNELMFEEILKKISIHFNDN